MTSTILQHALFIGSLLALAAGFACASASKRAKRDSAAQPSSGYLWAVGAVGCLFLVLGGKWSLDVAYAMGMSDYYINGPWHLSAGNFWMGQSMCGLIALAAALLGAFAVGWVIPFAQGRRVRSDRCA